MEATEPRALLALAIIASVSLAVIVYVFLRVRSRRLASREDTMGVFKQTATPGAAPRVRGAPGGRAPQPLGAPVKAEEAGLHRNFSCTAYDDCLRKALREGWAGWTCRRCAGFFAQGAARAAELEHFATTRCGAPSAHVSGAGSGGD